MTAATAVQPITDEALAGVVRALLDLMGPMILHPEALPETVERHERYRAQAAEKQARVAIAAWNRRAPDEAMGARIAEAEGERTAAIQSHGRLSKALVEAEAERDRLRAALEAICDWAEAHPGSADHRVYGTAMIAIGRGASSSAALAGADR